MYRKYHNTKTVADGIKFDSKLEAERYAQLKILERAGVIRALELQPSFDLLPSFRKNGKTWRKTVYKADFRYILAKDDSYIIEDVKGSTAVITDVFRLKQKLFEYKYPDYTISIVTSKDIKKFQRETKVGKMC
nr:MAG TPA: Endonuclease [Caudoviricetes sp.]